MADIGLTNAIRELISVMRSQAGLPAGGAATAAAHPFGGPRMGDISTSGVPQEWHDDMKKLTDGLEDHGEIIKEHGKEFKKATEDWHRGMVNIGFVLAPFAEGLHQFTKWTMTRPIELMGGEAGRAARGGLERAQGVGNVIFDIASAIAAAIPGAGLPVAAGIQLFGRAGGATLLGQFLGEKNLTRGGLEQNVLQDFGAMMMNRPEMLRFEARTARLGVQARAWGAGMSPEGMIRGLATDLAEDPKVIQQALADAFRIGGAEGIKNIDRKTIATMVREGFGDAATLIALQSVAGRYGYGRGDLRAMADRTGLRPEEVLPMMQRTRMQYFMFGGQTAEDINRFVGNTELAAINPMVSLQRMSQAAEGASGVQNEAAEMLQFRAFQQANPGASYMDFIEAKKSGFGSGTWRRTVGLIAQQGAAGGQIGRLLAAGMGVARPLEVQGIAGEYARGLGEDVTRTGRRYPATAAEQRIQQEGTLVYRAYDESVKIMQKSMQDLGGDIVTFSRNVGLATGDMKTAVDHIQALRRTLSAATSLMGHSLGRRPIDNTKVPLLPPEEYMMYQ